MPATCPKKPRCTSENCGSCCPHGSANICCEGVLEKKFCALDWSCSKSVYEAVEEVTGAAPIYAAGCSNLDCKDSRAFAAAVQAAESADQIIVVLGIDSNIETEGRDRTNTTLPGMQEDLALALLALNKPTVVVLLNGGIVSIDTLADLAASGTSSKSSATLDGTNKPAIVEAFYPGVEGARAIARSLFGLPGYNRWGKLPVTVYRGSFSEQVSMVDMSFTSGLGRTYRYWTGATPLYEFGTGLSLTDFALGWSSGRPPPAPVVSTLSASIALKVTVSNVGTREGDEVVMLYHVPEPAMGKAAGVRAPIRRLIDFQRITIPHGIGGELHFVVNASALGLVDVMGNSVLYPGVHGLVLECGKHSGALMVNVSVTSPQPLLIDTLL